MSENFDDIVREGTILKSMIGSRAYGTHNASSDFDYRHVTVLPAPYWTGLRNFEQRIWDQDGADVTIFDIRKFVKLALDANPNILEVLWSPAASPVHPIGAVLLSLKSAFLSRKVFKTFGGYARGQLHRARNKYAKEGPSPKMWKHLSHLIRLLTMGKEILRDGVVNVDRTNIDLQLLQDIRGGRLSMDDVSAMADTKEAELHASLAATKLPKTPDRARIECFLGDVLHHVVTNGRL